jgi:hypothetical protein
MICTIHTPTGRPWMSDVSTIRISHYDAPQHAVHPRGMIHTMHTPTGRPWVSAVSTIAVSHQGPSQEHLRAPTTNALIGALRILADAIHTRSRLPQA